VRLRTPRRRGVVKELSGCDLAVAAAGAGGIGLFSIWVTLLDSRIDWMRLYPLPVGL